MSHQYYPLAIYGHSNFYKTVTLKTYKYLLGNQKGSFIYFQIVLGPILLLSAFITSIFSHVHLTNNNTLSI